MSKEIWVLCEFLKNVPCSYTLELIGKATELAKTADCTVCCLAADTDFYACKSLFAAGSSKVYLFNKAGDEHTFSRCMAYLAKEHTPEVILGSATVCSRSVMPQVAALLKTGLTADCTELSINKDGLLLQTRPAFGGNLTADILCMSARPQMATVRSKIFPMPSLDFSRNGEIVEIAADYTMPELIKIIKSTLVPKQNNINDAQVIIAGGAGIGCKAGFHRLYELAQLLHGAVGATRAAVNAGYAHSSAQIGQTGFSVRPKLYIGFGISGAIQHTVGMCSAETIISVNTDPKSLIFDCSDIAIVADWQKTLEAMIHGLT